MFDYAYSGSPPRTGKVNRFVRIRVRDVVRRGTLGEEDVEDGGSRTYRRFLG